MEDLESAYKSALNAEGSALRENAAYLDSIQGRIDLFNNSVQTMWANFIDDDVVKFLVDVGTALIKLVDIVNPLTVAFAGLTAVLLLKHKAKNKEMGVLDFVSEAAANAATKGIKYLIENTSTVFKDFTSTIATSWSASMAGAATGTNAFTTSLLSAKAGAAGLGKGLLSFAKAHPILVGLTAAAIALGVAFKVYKKINPSHDELIEKLNKETEDLKDVQNELKSVNSELKTTKSRIEELEAKGTLSFVEEEELNRLREQTAELERQEKILQAQEKRARNKQIETALKAAKTDSNLKQEDPIVATAYAAASNAIADTTGFNFYAPGLQNKIVSAEDNTVYTNKWEDNLNGLKKAKEDLDKANEEFSNVTSQTEEKEYNKLKKNVEEAQNRVNKYNNAIDSMNKAWQTEYGEIGYVENATTESEKDWNKFYQKYQDYVDQQELINGEIFKSDVLNRVFGEQGTEVAQEFKEQFEHGVKNGKNPEAVFKDLLNNADYSDIFFDLASKFGIVVDDVLAYFTQVGEQIKNENIAIVQSYSTLAASVDSYKEALSQTSEIVVDGTKVTQEYKDSLTALGISEADLADCFDKNNNLVVKNASALNKLVKSSKSNVAQNVRLAKSHARLQYYNLYKQIHQLTNGKKVESIATLNQVKLLYAEMTALQKTIARYSMLEQQLLGATNAYDKFAEAQEIDETNDYESKAEELVGYLVDAFHTGKLGAESAQAAIKGLVPESVYSDLDTLDEKMAEVYKYFTEDLSDYFYVKFNDDGSLESAEMLVDNVKKFVEDGIAKGVFTGSWEEWDLDPTINSLDELAEKMDVTKEVAFAFLQAMETYDISWIGGDASTLLDKLTPNASQIEEFEKKLQEQLKNIDIKLAENTILDVQALEVRTKQDIDGSVVNLAYAPVLPNGKELTDEEFNKYVQDQLDSGKSLKDLTISGYKVYVDSFDTKEAAVKAANQLTSDIKDLGDMKSAYNLENDLYNTTSKMAELHVKLTTETLTEEEKQKVIEDINELQIRLNGLKEDARDKSLLYIETSESLNKAQENLTTYSSALVAAREAGESWTGTTIDGVRYTSKNIGDLEKKVQESTDKVQKLGEELVEIGDVTEYELTVGLEQAQADTEKFKNQFKGNAVMMDVFTQIETSGIESFGFEKGEDGKYTLESVMKAFPQLDETQAEQVRQFLGYVEAEHSINMQLGQDTPTVEQTLQSISDTLDKIATILSIEYGIDLDTTGAEKKTDSLWTKLKNVWDLLANLGNSNSISENSIPSSASTYVTGGSGSSSSAIPSSAASSGVLVKPKQKVRGYAIYANGTAHANGDWGTTETETALVGELGTELV